MIAIKDFKMPRGCYECPFADESIRMDCDYYCQAAKEKPDVQYGLNKPDWCPLVDVPDINVGKCSEIPNCSDCISRRTAIDALATLVNLPSAQPERLTDDDFETIRIHLSAYKERLCNQRRWKEAEEYQRIINRFMSFASAQPEQIPEHSVWFRIGETLVSESKGDITAEQAVEKIRDYLKRMEKPERKKGKWLLSDEQRREDTDNGNYLYFCSNCLRSDVHAKTQEVPYCWWCGADMRGEQE